jgi:hypothetical protein
MAIVASQDVRPHVGMCALAKPQEHLHVAYRNGVDQRYLSEVLASILIQPPKDLPVVGVVHCIGCAAFRSVGMQELDDLRVALTGCFVHRPGRAALGSMEVQPLDHVQVTVLRSLVHGNRRASLRALRVKILHDVEVAVRGSAVHCDRRALRVRIVSLQPLEHLEVAAVVRHRVDLGFGAVLAPVVMQILSYLKVVGPQRVVKCRRRAALGPILVQKPEHLKVAVPSSVVHGARRAVEPLHVQPLHDIEVFVAWCSIYRLMRASVPAAVVRTSTAAFPADRVPPSRPSSARRA